MNAFAPALAERYIDGGIDFILVAADVSLLARSTEEIAARFIADTSDGRRSSY